MQKRDIKFLVMGASFGFVSGTYFTLKKGLKNEHIRKGVINAITNKFMTLLYGKEYDKSRSRNRQNPSYYDVYKRRNAKI